MHHPARGSVCSVLKFERHGGHKESRKSFVSRARFLPFASLRVGMTTFANVFQHPNQDYIAKHPAFSPARRRS
jgi:hypothetical protein